MLPSRSWRAYPQSYRLEAARCKKCEKVFFPPRRVCNECAGREFENFNLKPKGTVVTHTIIRTPSDEYSGLAPFAVAIVQMEDGPKLTLQIVEADFDEIKIGMPVNLEFRRHYEDTEAGVIHYGHKAVPVRA